MMITVILVFILVSIGAPPWVYVLLTLHFMWSVIRFFEKQDGRRS